MPQLKEQVKMINDIIKKGLVEHKRIIPNLDQAGISRDNADQIARLVSIYKFKATNQWGQKLIKAVAVILDRILAVTAILLGAVLGGESIAVKVFAGSILNSKLPRYGDHLLYWLGLKKIEISGTDMMTAFTGMISATPQILKAMLIGSIIGFIGWIIISRLIIKLIDHNKQQKAIIKFLTQQAERNDNKSALS